MATTQGLSIGELLYKIKELGNYSDWRDLFQAIHDWGYTTDFTYNPVTDAERTELQEYLRDFIADVYGD